MGDPRAIVCAASQTFCPPPFPHLIHLTYFMHKLIAPGDGHTSIGSIPMCHSGFHTRRWFDAAAVMAKVAQSTWGWRCTWGPLTTLSGRCLALPFTWLPPVLPSSPPSPSQFTPTPTPTPISSEYIYPSLTTCSALTYMPTLARELVARSQGSYSY